MNAQDPSQPSGPTPVDSQRASPWAPTRLHLAEQPQVETTGYECPNCRRDFGDGVACQSCRQMAGLPNGISLASPARRLGGYLMEWLLFIVTLGVGYLVWWAIALGRAQTPGKQVLGMKVLRLPTIEPAGWGVMLLREVVAKGLIGILSWLTFGILNLWLLWDGKRQQLWDKVVDTVVVFDDSRQLG
jgi:uncharacterized RDD family membrane protein YckC